MLNDKMQSRCIQELTSGCCFSSVNFGSECALRRDTSYSPVVKLSNLQLQAEQFRKHSPMLN